MTNRPLLLSEEEVIHRVWVVEWQYKSGGSELGPDRWEADHNAGIWWTRDGAEQRMEDRIAESGGTASPYQFRVQSHVPEHFLHAERERAEKAEAWLAECYRLSGADPNGNEDWRLAPHAFEEVRRLRQDLEKAEADLRTARDYAEKLLYELAEVNSGPGARRKKEFEDRPFILGVRHFLAKFASPAAPDNPAPAVGLSDSINGVKAIPFIP